MQMATSNSVAFGAPLHVHKVDDIIVVIEDDALVLSSMSICVHVWKVFYEHCSSFTLVGNSPLLK